MSTLIRLKTEDIFTDEKINRGRQIELDVMRTISIILMISCHIQEVFFSKEWEDLFYVNMTDAYRVYLIFGNAVVAFGFMFAMGASIQFSRSQDPKKIISRGTKLILAWFLLKVACIYPLSVLFAESVNLSIGQYCMSYVFSSDILFFAGAFFIYYGLILKSEMSDIGFILITLLLFFCGNLSYFRTDSVFLQNVMGQFIWTDEASFPFLNWIIAPFLGVFWGKGLIRCKDKDALYIITGIASVLILFMFIKSLDLMELLVPEQMNEYADTDFFYRTTFLTALFSIAGLGVFLSACHLLSKIFSEGLAKIFFYFSSHLNAIYIMQWLVIPWGTILFPRPTEKHSPTVAFAMATAVFVFCILLILIYEKYSENWKLRHGYQNGKERKN